MVLCAACVALTDHPSSGFGVFLERCGRNPPRHLRYFFGRIHLHRDLVLFGDAGSDILKGEHNHFNTTTHVFILYSLVDQLMGSKLEAFRCIFGTQHDSQP